jgi:hypothetical protein
MLSVGLKKQEVDVELQKRGSARTTKNLYTPAFPVRRQSSLYPTNQDNDAPMEHNFVIVGDPGITFTTMLNQLGAYVQSVDLTRAPVHIVCGMRLVQINQTKVTDMQYQDIIDMYNEAINSNQPMTLRLLEVPWDNNGEHNLELCPDVAEALKWKQEMEDEHWNKSLKARAVVLIDGLQFQIFIIIVIFFDLSIFYIEWNQTGDPPLWLDLLSWIVMLIYLIEICVRM